MKKTRKKTSIIIAVVTAGLFALANIVRAEEGSAFYGQNVKIITIDGIVTLSGPVRSEAEKAAIMERAQNVVGDSEKIRDEMTVAGK